MRQVLELNPVLCLLALPPCYELQSSTQWSSVYRLADLHHMVDWDPSPHTDIAQACSPGYFADWRIRMGPTARTDRFHWKEPDCPSSNRLCPKLNRAGRSASGRCK